MSYKEAQKKYAKIGIDTEKAIKDLGKIAISLHCWQGDDVGGFETTGGASGGIATTGGKGNLIGAFIASFIIVCLRIALGQINMNTQLILVIIGVMLIVSVLIPSFRDLLWKKKATKS